MIIMIGYKCARRRDRSFDFIVCSGLINELGCPCCTVEYMTREYAAVKNLSIPTKISALREKDITLVIRTISLIRLIVGGDAMLVAVNRNQNMAIIGEIDIIPFDRYILRVWVIS
jgi:hypothetical protein